MIGRTISHYRILGFIGRGGMGEVYRAHDTRLKRDVALKVLPADVAEDRARLERFQREAEIVAGLNHPHIVTVFPVEETDGLHFFTMELVEGRPLPWLKDSRTGLLSAWMHAGKTCRSIHVQNCQTCSLSLPARRNCPVNSKACFHR